MKSIIGENSHKSSAYEGHENVILNSFQVTRDPKQACPEEMLKQVQHETFRVRHDSLFRMYFQDKTQGFDLRTTEI